MIFLVVQATYEHFQLGIFNNSRCIASYDGDKKNVNKEFIPTLDRLLHECNRALGDVHAIVVNQGPAPFSVIRILISAVNGISYATGIPLIGIDGLALLLNQCIQKNSQYNAHGVVLNAFNNELYYGFFNGVNTIFGCASVDNVAQQIMNMSYSTPIVVGGAGLPALRPLIHSDSVIFFGALSYTSLADLIEAAAVPLARKEYTSLLTPLHLKIIHY